MTREERFKMDMINEFKLMCEIVGNSGRIILNKHRMLKALEQEPRKGKWTKLSDTVPCMNCPICGSTFTLILGGDKMHYCPNCGADMREGEE